MQSWVDICNAALVRVGAQKINSMDEAGNEARICKAVLEFCKEQVLVRHVWWCARSRAALPLAGIAGRDGAPNWPYKYAYGLPADFLRAVRIETGTPYGSPGAPAGLEPFILEKYGEDRVLLCNRRNAELIYVAGTSSPGDLSAECKQALVACLATELSTALGQSLSMRERFQQEYKAALNEAVFIDATQANEFVPPDDTYLRARGGYTDTCYPFRGYDE